MGITGVWLGHGGLVEILGGFRMRELCGNTAFDGDMEVVRYGG